VTPRARRLPGAGTLLVVLAVLVPRLPTLAEPLGMDQALFAVIGEGLLRGERLYVDLWDHKPPAIYALYAGVIAVAGAAPWAIALAALGAAVATALLLRALVTARSGARAGLLAGTLYGLLANPILLGGFYATAQAEGFMEPLVAAALLLGARREWAGGAAARLGAGLALGTAALFKPTALVFAPLVVWGGGGIAGEAGAGWRGLDAPTLRRFALGLAAPAALALAYVAASGTLGAALDALVTWNLGAARAAAAGPLALGSISLTPAGLLAALLDGILLLGPFLLFALGGAALSGARAAPLAWLAAALVTVLAQGKLYRYHYQLLLAPIVWLSALGLAEAAALLGRGGARVRRAAGPIVAVAALATLLPYAGSVRAYWARHRFHVPLPTGTAREEMLATYAWSDPPMRYADAALVAARIRAASAPEDRIAVLGFDPQIYWLSRRAPAGRYLAHDHLRAPGAASRLAADFARRPPRWVVVATDQVAATDFPEVTGWIAAHTEPRGAVGRFALFERTR
jgi:hypothetical protein